MEGRGFADQVFLERFLISGGRGNKYILAGRAAEKKDVCFDVLRFVSHPIDHDIKLETAQQCSSGVLGWRACTGNEVAQINIEDRYQKDTAMRDKSAVLYSSADSCASFPAQWRQ